MRLRRWLRFKHNVRGRKGGGSSQAASAPALRPPDAFPSRPTGAIKAIVEQTTTIFCLSEENASPRFGGPASRRRFQLARRHGKKGRSWPRFSTGRTPSKPRLFGQPRLQACGRRASIGPIRLARDSPVGSAKMRCCQPELRTR